MPKISHERFFIKNRRHFAIARQSGALIVQYSVHTVGVQPMYSIAWLIDLAKLYNQPVGMQALYSIDWLIDWFDWIA